jgi:xylose isomerase
VSDVFFTELANPVVFSGAESTDPLAFKVYDADRLVLGKRMEDHLRMSVCYWHSFNWSGNDVFGSGTFDRPWLDNLHDLDAAKLKMDAAFEFFGKLGTPYFCFHDVDIAPTGSSFAAAGASTNPNPEVFAYAAAQVKNAIDATHRLGGEVTYCGAVGRATKHFSTPGYARKPTS